MEVIMSILKSRLLITTSISVFLILALVLSFFLKQHLAGTTAYISGSLVHLSFEEVIARSHLIAKGKFVGQSEPFRVKPTNGADESVFIDYYLEPTEILRGSLKPNSNRTISIRMEGGESNRLKIINNDNPKVMPGDEVIVFLCETNWGGGYTTNENYYILTGITQGIYFGKKDVYECAAADRESLIWPKSANEIAKISEANPIDYNWVYSTAIINLQKNVESGFMSQEECDSEIAKFQQNKNNFAERIAE